MGGYAPSADADNQAPGGGGARRRSRGPPVVITERGRTALLRKYGTEEMSDSRGITRARLLSRFVSDLGSKKFGAIVFGYEGVLHDTRADHAMPLKEIGAGLEKILRDGIRIGIVSGMSHEEIAPKLRHTIPSKYWEEVHVGYCNCAEIITLDEDPDTDQKLTSELRYFLDRAASGESEIPWDKIIPHPPHQISVGNDAIGNYGATRIIAAMEKMQGPVLRNLKVLESEQYTDIIPRRVSKYDMVGRIRDAIRKDRHVLCIGCKGKWPGSDSELLTHRHSLSTDTVSATAASCWNLLPAGERGEQGALAYMRGISMHGSGGGFGMSI